MQEGRSGTGQQQLFSFHFKERVADVQTIAFHTENDQDKLGNYFPQSNI